MRDKNNDYEASQAALPDGKDLEIPWHLRFRGGLEARFVQEFRESVRRAIIPSTLLVILIYMLAYLVENRISPEATTLTWRARLLALLATALVPLAAFQTTQGVLQQPAIAAMALVTAGAHLYMGGVVQHDFAYMYHFIVFMPVLLMATVFRVTLLWAIPVTLLILLMAFLVLVRSTEVAPEGGFLIFMWLATMSAITLYGLYFHEQQQRRLFVSEQLMSLQRFELQQANRVLTSQAVEDQLTGTVNRRGMEERLRFLLEAPHSRGRSDAASIAILLFDIDDFKRYNDTYGHQKGDETLSRVAGTARDMVQRAGDFVARYGGEEFLVVLQGTSPEDALVFAERLRRRVEQLGISHATSSAGDAVTISVGIAWSTPALRDARELIQQADSALYAAKAAGRNRVAVFGREGSVRMVSGKADEQ